MKKIMQIMLGAMCVSAMISCNNGNNKQDAPQVEEITEKKTAEPIKIQSKFFGLELGKSSWQEAMKVVKESDWRFATMGSEAIMIMSPITFGDFDWEGLTLNFTRGVLTSFYFNQDLTSQSKAKRKEMFDKLANQLKDKYKNLFSKESNDEYILASDDIIEVSLGHESDGTDYVLIFQYSIKEDKISEIAPSEL